MPSASPRSGATALRSTRSFSRPGAEVHRTETSGRHAPDTSEGPIVGWTTVRELRLAGGARAEQVVARARTDLKRAGSF